MPKIDLRVMKTKESLQEALVEMLKQKRLEDISVTALTKRAKVNRGTFYLHYGQVEDLFEEYFKEITADLASSYKEPYRNPEGLDLSRLDSTTIRIFHHIEKYKPFYRIIFSKSVPLMYYYLLFDEINKLLLQDQASLYNDRIDPGFFAAYQANAIIGLIIKWYQEDFSHGAGYLNRQLVEILNMKLE